MPDIPSDLADLLGDPDVPELPAADQVRIIEQMRDDAARQIAVARPQLRAALAAKEAALIGQIAGAIRSLGDRRAACAAEIARIQQSSNTQPGESRTLAAP